LTEGQAKQLYRKIIPSDVFLLPLRVASAMNSLSASCRHIYPSGSKVVIAFVASLNYDVLRGNAVSP
jgi:hypothetical protein